MRTDPAAAEQVRSPDGTSIALWRSGQGRPLVALHGVTIDHSTWDGVRTALERVATLIAVDRRGHGASDQGPASRNEDGVGVFSGAWRRGSNLDSLPSST
jgi:pimeloyl-ACP methyl ester carboxylesterase